MAPRNRKLEQAKPKERTPLKDWKRKEPSPPTYKQKGFSGKDLPRGTITQHRAKPGVTSPQ
jgi:hypothetical protein